MKYYDKLIFELSEEGRCGYSLRKTVGKTILTRFRQASEGPSGRICPKSASRMPYGTTPICRT